MACGFTTSSSRRDPPRVARLPSPRIVSFRPTTSRAGTTFVGGMRARNWRRVDPPREPSASVARLVRERVGSVGSDRSASEEILRSRVAINKREVLSEQVLGVRTSKTWPQTKRQSLRSDPPGLLALMIQGSSTGLPTGTGRFPTQPSPLNGGPLLAPRPLARSMIEREGIPIAAAREDQTPQRPRLALMLLQYERAP